MIRRNRTRLNSLKNRLSYPNTRSWKNLQAGCTCTHSSTRKEERHSTLILLSIRKSKTSSKKSPTPMKINPNVSRKSLKKRVINRPKENWNEGKLRELIDWPFYICDLEYNVKHDFISLNNYFSSFPWWYRERWTDEQLDCERIRWSLVIYNWRRHCGIQCDSPSK